MQFKARWISRKRALETALVDVAGLAADVIHQQILSESVGRREISLAAAKLRHLLHEMDEAIIARQHESIDQDPCAFALRHFLERLRHHERVEAESILVDAAILESKRRGLAVGDHHDLPHVFLLARKNALRKAKPLSRVGVV